MAELLMFAVRNIPDQLLINLEARTAVAKQTTASALVRSSANLNSALDDRRMNMYRPRSVTLPALCHVILLTEARASNSLRSIVVTSAE
jgi:hypothetical protein